MSIDNQMKAAHKEYDDDKYKFNELDTLRMVQNNIVETYNAHYSMNKIQSTEFIFDAGHGEGFCLGNIIKYAQRYGKKNGKNTDDLLKIIHYAIILLGVENETNKSKKSREFNESEYS